MKKTLMFSLLVSIPLMANEEVDALRVELENQKEVTQKLEMKLE